jgi:hypothetical protein
MGFSERREEHVRCFACRTAGREDAKIDNPWLEKYIQADELKRADLGHELLEHSLRNLLPTNHFERNAIYGVICSYLDDLATEVTKAREDAVELRRRLNEVCIELDDLKFEEYKRQLK